MLAFSHLQTRTSVPVARVLRVRRGYPGDPADPGVRTDRRGREDPVDPEMIEECSVRFNNHRYLLKIEKKLTNFDNMSGS